MHLRSSSLCWLRPYNKNNSEIPAHLTFKPFYGNIHKFQQFTTSGFIRMLLVIPSESVVLSTKNSTIRLYLCVRARFCVCVCVFFLSSVGQQDYVNILCKICHSIARIRFIWMGEPIASFGVVILQWNRPTQPLNGILWSEYDRAKFLHRFAIYSTAWKIVQSSNSQRTASLQTFFISRSTKFFSETISLRSCNVFMSNSISSGQMQLHLSLVFHFVCALCIKVDIVFFYLRTDLIECKRVEQIACLQRSNVLVMAIFALGLDLISEFVVFFLHKVCSIFQQKRSVGKRCWRFFVPNSRAKNRQ